MQTYVCLSLQQIPSQSNEYDSRCQDYGAMIQTLHLKVQEQDNKIKILEAKNQEQDTRIQEQNAKIAQQSAKMDEQGETIKSLEYSKLPEKQNQA